VSTYIELRDQAAKEIKAHIRSTSSDSSHHFVVDHSNYLVEHGAVLLAALRPWAEPRHMTDRDLLALIDLADAATLENIAEQLAMRHRPDDLLASVQLEGMLLHLNASCTTHLSSHGGAFNRAESTLR
jgi:hypothetical protein